MKNKELVLSKFDDIRYKVKDINYLFNTGGAFSDIQEAFEILYELIDDTKGLVSIEHDAFRSNQII